MLTIATGNWFSIGFSPHSLKLFVSLVTYKGTYEEGGVVSPWG